MEYTVILAVLIIAQVVVVALFFSNVFDDEVKKQVTNLINTEYVDLKDSSLTSIVMNVIMLNYQCCGLTDYEDFFTASKWNRNQTLQIGGSSIQVSLITPISCCATTGTFPDVTLVDDFCAVYPNDTISNWKKGCWTTVTSDLNQYRTWAILISSGIIVVQAVIMLIVIFLIKANQD